MKLISNMARRLRPLVDPMSWFLIIAGLVTFSTRLPLPADGPINAPMAITIFQTGGLIFAVYGMQMMASMVFWPSLRVGALMEAISSSKQDKGNPVASAVILAGLLCFNGLATIGFCYWLTTALGAGLVGGR